MSKRIDEVCRHSYYKDRRIKRGDTWYWVWRCKHCGDEYEEEDN